MSQFSESALLPGLAPAWVRSQVIGRGAIVRTPFGERRVIYADHVASGRSLRWIEAFILDQVLPHYANTHTEDSATGARMTALARDAASHIKRCLGAERCKLLFCGTGCTAAIKRLQEMLGLAVPEALRERLTASLEPARRPLVLVGPYEHHSNEVTWRETIAEVVELPLVSDGAIDLDALRAVLRDAQATGRPLIGSFSAASNVTGALTDTRAVARLLHAHGALAFFDFAAVAPHTRIDMRCGAPDGYDAIFLSAHKLVGGPGTPGILAFDPALYRLRAPSTAGGGTVSHVSAHEHHFVHDIEQREDAGTPGTVQLIRAALAFAVKEAVGVESIEGLEGDMIRRAIARLRRHPRLELLGNLDAPRLAILSFVVRCADGRYLHPRLVVRLLNDLFGIQSRGGCACAGPYAHRLLHIDRARVDALRDAVLDGFEVVKPGWTRLNFSYFIRPEEFGFLLDAIEFIADHGERFIGQYQCDWRTGSWHHPSDEAQPGLLGLAMQGATRPRPSPPGYRDCLANAHALLGSLPAPCEPANELPQRLSAALVSFGY
ncbi:MAG: aminotransferase class V-fold PLP-dependent enzyme [Variovorax sp.]|nr:MAG: aminotransferase class V-fold PLP-dependent enzyme [Variovorax sp.]